MSLTWAQSYKACYAKRKKMRNYGKFLRKLKFCVITQFSKLQSYKKCVFTDFSNLPLNW